MGEFLKFVLYSIESTIFQIFNYYIKIFLDWIKELSICDLTIKHAEQNLHQAIVRSAQQIKQWKLCPDNIQAIDSPPFEGSASPTDGARGVVILPVHMLDARGVFRIPYYIKGPHFLPLVLYTKEGAKLFFPMAKTFLGGHGPMPSKYATVGCAIGAEQFDMTSEAIAWLWRVLRIYAKRTVKPT